MTVIGVVLGSVLAYILCGLAFYRVLQATHPTECPPRNQHNDADATVMVLLVAWWPVLVPFTLGIVVSNFLAKYILK